MAIEENRIPKIIHYCWLSGDEMPQSAKDCIESWRIVMPDYEIKLWDESSLNDEIRIPWVEQACAAKRWAFVTDYIRLYALYNYGGIYLDSDVRAIKSFDPYLKHRGFTGIEWHEGIFLSRNRSTTTGVNLECACLAAEKGHPMVRDFMSHYEGRDFDLGNGYLDLEPMPHVLTPIAAKYGFDNTSYWEHQVLEEDFHVYPYDFCPGRTHAYFEPIFNHNTVAFHLHHTSWASCPRGWRRVHSPYTEFRIYLRDFFRGVKKDVILRQGYQVRYGKKYTKIKDR